AAGMNGMIGGQVIDIKGAKNFDQLKTVYEMKTGALIKLSCYLGAISADANETQLSLINQFAENIGIAFQIKDDILDIESTNDILGKPVGSDEKRGIITYVTLFGLDGAKEKLNYHTKIAKQSLSSFGKNSDFFMNLADYLLERVK
ncbi:MAG: polyprenyl synthetase family protein, partial [Clostridia bacterium]|nr:polyprenyl synthetase family protein [Clostridia bacterium]